MGESKRKSEKSKGADEGGSKRRRTEEEEEGGSSRGKKSHRKEKRHKHRSDKDKKSKDDHKGKHRKRDRKLIDFKELSTDDYFLKNNEFATWLKEEKDVFFSDLSTESSRSLFQDFVKEWNRQRLDDRYYEGISVGPRSAHNWKIKS